MTPTITIDTREPPELVKNMEALCARDSIPTLHRALQVGDYRWERVGGGEVLIERKTISDLLSSLADGRWSRQINELATADLPVVMLCGELVERNGFVLHRGKESRWRFGSVDGALFVSQLLGIHLVHSGTSHASQSDRILGLYQATTRDYHASLVRKPSKFLASEAERMGVNVLTALPGLGPVVAKKLLARYTSPLAALYGLAYPDGSIPLPANQPRWARILKGEGDGQENQTG